MMFILVLLCMCRLMKLGRISGILLLLCGLWCVVLMVCICWLMCRLLCI